MDRLALIAFASFAVLAAVLIAAWFVGASPDDQSRTIGDLSEDRLAIARSELFETLSGKNDSVHAPTPAPVAPALSLPAPRHMAFANVLNPQTFDELWVVSDDSHGFTANGPQYFLAHTHTQGGAVGNAVNEAGLTPGAVIEIAGVRYDVSAVTTVAKPDIGTLPIWQSDDPDEAFLIVCLWNNGSLATHNLVIELHRA